MRYTYLKEQHKAKYFCPIKRKQWLNRHDNQEQANHTAVELGEAPVPAVDPGVGDGAQRFGEEDAADSHGQKQRLQDGV